MAWHVENESRPRPPALPEKQRIIGSVTVEWIPAKPGEAAIICEGGTIDDRWLAEVVTREELAACGIRQARFTFDSTSGSDKISAVDHSLAWSPGSYGKGAVDDHTGAVHTWNVVLGGERAKPTHDDYYEQNAVNSPSISFHIRPDGGTDLVDPEDIAYVQAADARLTAAPDWQPMEGPQWGDGSPFDRGPRESFSKLITATWDDIMAKAKRLIQSGNVTLLRNGYNNIVAHVIGDHGEYQCEISRDDPNSRAITQWTCECPWDQYAFQRTRQWKKYEARPCAHVLAAYWKSQGTPLDEDAPPGASPAGGVPGQNTPFPQPPQGQAPLSPFAPQMPQQGPGMGLQPGPDGGAMPGLPPATQMEGPPQLGPPSALPPVGNPPMQPGVLNAPFAPPAQTGLIPTFPLEPAPQPVSVPGARPGPYPANPVQQPGTFSHTYTPRVAAEFIPDSRARLNEATLGQSEGREGATDAGQWMEIPEGANVEVVYQDPSTGWVEIRYPLKGGPMTSYHVTCFVEPEKLAPLEGDSPMAPRRRR